MQDRIETFQDLLDILDARPEWAQALRERLLTPELLALPERFATFSNMVEQRLHNLQTDTGDLKGHSIPTAVQRMVGLVAQTANVRRPRWLDNTDIVDIADDAAEAGRADIPENEMASFRAIDLAMTAADKATRQQCYVIIECSYTVSRNDADRALRNAGHMSRFTGIPAVPLTAGRHIPEDVIAYADRIGVRTILVTPKATAPN